MLWGRLSWSPNMTWSPRMKITISQKGNVILKKKKGKQAINDSHQAIKDLKNAKTPEEKMRAAQRLADIVGDM